MSKSRFTILLAAESGVPLDFMEARSLTTNVNSTTFVLEQVEGEESLLQLKALSNAKTLEEGLRFAVSWGQAIMSFVGFLTQTAMNVKIDRAWDTSVNTKSGTFLQFIHDIPLKPAPRRAFSFQDFAQFQTKYTVKSAEDQFRIARAIRWQRAGLEGVHVIDQFTGYWIGLEVLDYFMRGDIEFQTCPKTSKCNSTMFTCENGHTHQRERLNRGLRKMLGKHYRKMVAIRNKIAHGEGKLQDLVADCSKYIPIAAGTLINEIKANLGMPKDSRLPSLFLRGNYQVARLLGNLEAIDKTTDLSTEPLFDPFFSFDTDDLFLDFSADSPRFSVPPQGRCDKRFLLSPVEFSLVGPDGISTMNKHHLTLLKEELSKF